MRGERQPASRDPRKRISPVQVDLDEIDGVGNDCDRSCPRPKRQCARLDRRQESPRDLGLDCNHDQPQHGAPDQIAHGRPAPALVPDEGDRKLRIRRQNTCCLGGPSSTC